MADPRVIMAARNSVDWYAMMWDLRGLRYVRDAFGFRTIDPPPPYHGWVTLASLDAPIPNIVAPFAGLDGFGVKDAFAAHDLSGFGLAKLFEASWIWHAPDAQADTQDWEQITTPDALDAWEDAWSVTSPTAYRQFPVATLARTDVRIWGRRAGDGYDAGAIGNLSANCVGLSNCFGSNMHSAATALCAEFGSRLPLVGYDCGDALAEAQANGWEVTGPLTVWHSPTDEM
jgi:hypothetical protein